MRELFVSYTIVFNSGNKTEGDGTRKFLGSFDTPNEAFYAYKTFKEGLLKRLADKYKEHLSDDLYKALYNYKVKIDD